MSRQRNILTEWLVATDLLIILVEVRVGLQIIEELKRKRAKSNGLISELDTSIETLRGAIGERTITPDELDTLVSECQELAFRSLQRQ